MKKRSVLMTVLAMVLVAVISVGSTLAYLTATSKEVKNTFKFADMTVTLTEPSPSVPPQVTTSPNKDGGYDYTNILPDSTLGKNPQVSTTTAVDAYLFIKVSGASDLVKPCSNEKGEINGNPIEAEGWTAVGTPDGSFNGIYYREVIVADKEFGPWDVFEYVKVAKEDIMTSKDGEGNVVTTGKDGNVVSLDPIKVEVFEIQKEGIDLAKATTEAETYFANTAAAAGTTGGAENNNA